ncbi:MAG: amino acid ABC transporter substrate-binding protein [Alphaproteobacteria bacterium]|nr:MAG: amino acid ABC transporter substrate-binding protein [Alphaproteobacteria bacterium]
MPKPPNSSLTRRRVLGSAAAALPLLLVRPALAQEREVSIGYLGLADDPLYAERRGYAGVRLRQRVRPLDGVKLALRGARVLGRALGVGFALDERLVADSESAAAAGREMRDGGALAVLADLPDEALAALADALGGAGLVIDLRSPAMRWRAERCPQGLLHAAPSRAMRAEALAQYLRKRSWESVLMLVGRHPDDGPDAAAARGAIAKFGLDLADERAFELTGDPTRREQSNVALLTGGVSYDVVWLIDNDGEYGRYVPFATYHPRPVVGSEGLRPVAWHWTFERYGAPQLNRRFERRVGRVMGEDDWVGWAGLRSLLQSVQDTGATAPETVAERLLAEEFRVDLYKGIPGSYRPWNGQLRQPILLATHDAVTAVAPLEGYEHQRNVLDTLGLDLPEVQCR